MKVFTEKEAGSFFSKQGFNILSGFYLKKESDLEKINLDFPYVAKISGKKIIHKKKQGGIILDIKDVRDIINSFNYLKKIKGCEEVFFQKQISGIELILGIKKTPEFGHVLVFGEGGTGVEDKEDFSFRVFPISLYDIKEMIRETKVLNKLKYKDIFILENEIFKLNDLVKKYPEIKELDINPLLISSNKPYFVDTRIVFD